MNGSDDQSCKTVMNEAQRRSRWLWTLGAVATVVAFGTAVRMAELPQASAQAPIVKPGSASAPPRPTGSAPQLRQAQPVAGPQNQVGPSTPIRPQGPPAAAPSAIQPAAAVKTASPPPANTLQVMAVVNGEQITRTELGRECIRRYGEEVLESMVNRQLIADACAQKGIQI